MDTVYELRVIKDTYRKQHSIGKIRSCPHSIHSKLQMVLSCEPDAIDVVAVPCPVLLSSVYATDNKEAWYD